MKSKKKQNFWKVVFVIVGVAALLWTFSKGFLSEESPFSPTQTIEATASASEDLLEIPISKAGQEVIEVRHKAYSLGYNQDYKTPYWVAWELTKEETYGDEQRSDKFFPDPALPEPRTEYWAYSGTGYNRGHMAPAGDMRWDATAMQESFYMSNTCPQNQELNDGDWNELENKCRRWARKYKRVHIICGPVYRTRSPRRIGKQSVALPDGFYKVVYVEKGKNEVPTMMGFLFSQKNAGQPLDRYLVAVDDIEELVGFDFFPALPDEVEDSLERIVPALLN